MDAWLCLKAGTGPGGLELGVKVSGQLLSSLRPKGNTTPGSRAMKDGGSMASAGGWHLFKVQVLVKCLSSERPSQTTHLQ
jgi:hypothetical protein